MRVVDGRIELDMDSLTVDHAVVDAADHLEPLEYVDESAATRFTNSASYSKKNKSEKWSEEDTELFFEVSSLVFIPPESCYYFNGGMWRIVVLTDLGVYRCH